MPFYNLPNEWKSPESGVVYTQKELFDRIVTPAAHIETELGPDSPFVKVLGQISFIDLDRIFNGAPN